LKNWVRGGIVAAGIVGLSFFMASTEANEELFQQLKLEGLGVNVNLLKADTQGLVYERNGGLYRFTLNNNLPYKDNLLEDSTMFTYYLVEGGLVYTDIEGNYKSYTFEGGLDKPYLDGNALVVINEGVVTPLLDTDGDGILDEVDNCVNISNKDQSDIDNDGVGTKCDEDIDGDGYSNDLEYAEGTNRYKGSEYPSNVQPDMTTHPVEPPQTNNDIDGDGILNVADNCPTVSNPTQWDNNENGVGNLCDPDIDGDGYSNTVEVEAGSSPWESDSTPEDTNGYVPPKDCNV